MAGSFDVGKVYGDIKRIKSAEMQNKLNEMKLREYEKGVGKKASRDMLAQQYITPAQPEMQQAPQYDMGQGTPNLAQYQYGQAPYQEATPASFDRQGYGQGLLGVGDIEGAMQVEAEIQQQKKAEIEEVYNIAKVNPKMGVKVWNKGPLAKEYGTIEHLGVKDGMQIFNNKDDGEITGVNKNTGELTIIRQGDPTKGKEKDKDINKELTSRTKIAGLVNKDLQAKYGKAGLKYDSLMQEWIFPPNFDQAQFWDDYNKLEGVYQKEYKIKPIEKEKKWPEFKGKKGGARPSIDSFYGE